MSSGKKKLCANIKGYENNITINVGYIRISIFSVNIATNKPDDTYVLICCGVSFA